MVPSGFWSRPIRLLVLLLAAVLFLSGSPGSAATARRADHVVLVSIDGLRPEFYLDAAWPAPMLRQLMARGSHAEGVLGVFPSVTYPSHTTLVTGVRPARHGIYYNEPFEKDGITGRWYWEAAAIKVPSLFTRVREAGLRSAAVGWPVTVGAPIDWNVPEIWSLDKNLDSIERTRQVCHPPDLLAEIEREATGRLRMTNFAIEHQTHDDRVADAAAYLLTTYRPALLAVHLVGTDHFQHEDGRQSERVERAVAAADRAVAQIYEAAEAAGMLERTVFVITGDHGHIDRYTAIAPNVALAEAGLVGKEPNRGKWRAVFHTAAASAFLHLADPRDREAENLARQALEGLPPAVRALYRIVEKDELERLGAAPEASFALAPRPGIDFKDDVDGALVRPVQGATHGYLPTEPQMPTGLIVAGAGIRRGGAAARLEMVDIAPLIAELLGLPLPGAEGQAPLGFLTRIEAAQPSVATAAPAATPMPVAALASKADDAEAEAELRRACEKYAKLLVSGQVDELAQLYTADGELLDPGMETLRGREQIRSYLALLRKQYKVEASTLVPDRIEVRGEQASVWGIFTQKAGPQGQKSSELRGRFVAEWQKEAAGWRIRRLLVQPGAP